MALVARTALHSSQPASAASQLPASLDPLMRDLITLSQSKKLSVVGIGGCPGIGKTHLTQLLFQELKRSGVSCAVVHFDDWTNPPDKREDGYFNLKGIHDFFSSFSQGMLQIEKPVYNEFSGQHSNETLDLRRIDLIIFEGLVALSSDPSFNYFSYCNLGIYIDASRDDIWRWKRERPSSKSRTDVEFEEHMRAVFEYHDKNIEPSKNNASWIVRKDSNHNYTLLNK